MSNFGEPVSLNWGAPEQPRRRILPIIAVGAVTFVAGGVIAAAVVFWNGRNDQMAEMAAILAELRSGQQTAQTPVAAPLAVSAMLPVSPAPPAAEALAAEEITTRDAAERLLAVTEAAAVEVATAPAEPESFLTSATAARAPAPFAPSAADQIRALVELGDTAAGVPGSAQDTAPAATPSTDLSMIAQTIGAEEQQDTSSAADQVRYVAAREAMDQAAGDTSLARDEARLAVLGEALSGVREIARRTANGQYTIQRKKVPGQEIQPHFVVRGYEREQIALIELLRTAAENDIISYPPYVVNANGTIDAAALLLSAVQEALAGGSTDEQWAGERLANDIADVRAAETYIERGERYYTVLSGDSLAFIALQFYGTTNTYTRIFEANRDVIDSPERIRVGQRLRIPY